MRLFLGSFSTAKTALGLGRNACGFELNRAAFEYQTQQIQNIKYGELLSTLREVPQNKLTNKGKRLSDKEIKEIIDLYVNSIKSGYTKKNAIDHISEQFGRGYWSIMNILDRHLFSKDSVLQEKLFE